MIDNKLLAKLRQPVHITYISMYVFGKNLEQTREILNELIEKDIVEKSDYDEDYYVLKSKINKK